MDAEFACNDCGLTFELGLRWEGPDLAHRIPATLVVCKNCGTNHRVEHHVHGLRQWLQRLVTRKETRGPADRLLARRGPIFQHQLQYTANASWCEVPLYASLRSGMSLCRLDPRHQHEPPQMDLSHVTCQCCLEMGTLVAHWPREEGRMCPNCESNGAIRTLTCQVA